MALLSKRKLCRASEEWQACALETLTILTSKSLLEMAPQAIDDVIIKGIPLLFLMRNGNEFGGHVAEVLNDSAMSKHHSILKAVSKISEEEGELPPSLPSTSPPPIPLILLPVVWKTGCKGESYRDEKALSSANAAIYSHLGEKIGHLGSEKLNAMV